MSLISLVPVENAANRGHRHVKLTFDNWGNVGTGADDDSIRYEIKRPIYGAQIAAESEVGEVFVEFNPGGLNNPAPACAWLNTVANGLAKTQSLYIRRGEPYFWETPANVYLQATPETMWGDEYYPSTGDPGHTANFGHLLNSYAWFHGPLWPCLQMPKLSVILFLAPTPSAVAEPSLGYLGNARFPWIPANIGVSEQLLGFYPIQHRERVRVHCANNCNTDPSQNLELRFTGVNGWSISTPGVDYQLREFELASAPLILPTLSRYSYPIRHPEATWLGVYGYCPAGIAGNEAPEIWVTAD